MIAFDPTYLLCALPGLAHAADLSHPRRGRRPLAPDRRGTSCAPACSTGATSEAHGSRRTRTTIAVMLSREPAA